MKDYEDYILDLLKGTAPLNILPIYLAFGGYIEDFKVVVVRNENDYAFYKANVKRDGLNMQCSIFSDKRGNLRVVSPNYVAMIDNSGKIEMRINTDTPMNEDKVELVRSIIGVLRNDGNNNAYRRYWEDFQKKFR